MTPGAMLLYIALGVGLDRLWLARYEVFEAVMGTLDRICADPEPSERVVAPRSCVRTLRDVGDDEGGEAG